MSCLDEAPRKAARESHREHELDQEQPVSGDTSRDSLRSQLERLQSAIDYRFKQVGLLKQSLTHRSFANESVPRAGDYERLEFLGDAVIELVVTTALYQRNPAASEGDMSSMRARIVATCSLARAAQAWGLDRLVRLGKGERRTGGAQKPRILAGTFEAVMGAIMLDAGFETCRRVLAPWLDATLEQLGTQELFNHKSRLQRRIQASSGATPTYIVKEHEGPPHRRSFRVVVEANGVPLGEGKGASVREAGQNAAKRALAKLDARNDLPRATLDSVLQDES